jgi:hypothetical protein
MSLAVGDFSQELFLWPHSMKTTTWRLSFMFVGPLNILLVESMCKFLHIILLFSLKICINRNRRQKNLHTVCMLVLYFWEAQLVFCKYLFTKKNTF